MDKKHVYFFGSGMTEGNKDMKMLLGGKGAGSSNPRPLTRENREVKKLLKNTHFVDFTSKDRGRCWKDRGHCWKDRGHCCIICIIPIFSKRAPTLLA